MKKINFLLIAVIFSTISLFGQKQTQRQFNSMSEILQTAKKEGKLILIDCYFTGCAPCAWMDQQVFPDKKIMSIVDEYFVLAKFDVLKPSTADTLCYRYAIWGFPTFLVLNNEGQLIDRFSGFKEVDKFSSLLNQGVTNSKNGIYLKGFSATYSDPYPDFYSSYYSKKKKKTEASFINKYVRDQKDWFEEKTALIIMTFMGKLDPDIKQYYINNFNKYLTSFGFELSQRALDIALTSLMIRNIENQKDKFDLTAFIDSLKKEIPSNNLGLAGKELAKTYFIKNQKDSTAYNLFIEKNPKYK